MKTYKELMMFMRTEEYAIRSIALVESIMGDNFKSLRRLEPNIQTLNDYANHIEDDAAQQSGFLTIRSAYEYEYALKRVLTDADFHTVSKVHNSKEQKSDFGVIVADRKLPVYFEVKTTQTKGGWQGATHSEGAGKVDNYILISYTLNRDIKLPPLDESAIHGAFESVHFSVIEGFSMGWRGNANDTNSRTTARIPVKKARKYSKQIVIGGLRTKNSRGRKQIWCQPIRQSLDTWRDSAGVLAYRERNVAVAA